MRLPSRPPEYAGALLGVSTVMAIGVAAMVLGCSARANVTDVAQLPPDLRESYEVFAHRCSKCHSLSRPLDSGIDDDAYWAKYVRRMRLQPGSGISKSDEAHVLRYLHHYSIEERRRKAKAHESGDPSLRLETPTPAPARTATESNPPVEAGAGDSGDAS
jgi:hypothetical protein